MAQLGYKSYKDAVYPDQARKLCLLGATDIELADFFDVSEQCLNRWKKKYPEFGAAIKKGKMIADAKVATRLHQRACGYSHEDVIATNYKGDVTLTPVTKHYPPDTSACIFWLHNRQRDKWRRGGDGEPATALSKEELLKEISERLPD